MDQAFQQFLLINMQKDLKDLSQIYLEMFELHEKFLIFYNTLKLILLNYFFFSLSFLNHKIYIFRLIIKLNHEIERRWMWFN